MNLPLFVRESQCVTVTVTVRLCVSVSVHLPVSLLFLFSPVFLLHYQCYYHRSYWFSDIITINGIEARQGEARRRRRRKRRKRKEGGGGIKCLSLSLSLSLSLFILLIFFFPSTPFVRLMVTRAECFFSC